MAGTLTTKPKIGLALGGGGARGLAHIPMLEVFDELGIKPAMIAGSSAGALIGAAYAGGMSGAEIREHALSLLSKQIDMARHIFGTKQTRLGDIFSLKGMRSLHLDGQKLADIALPDGLPRMIEDQKIPFKVIATDFERLEEVVFSSGSVLQAVGASIAIPGFIAAPRIDGRIHVDGGVKNPVPFDHVTEGMDFVVAVDVTGRPKPVTRAHPSNIELAVGSLFIMFHELANLRRIQSPPAIYIEPNVDNFAAVDFFKVKQIFQAAEPAKDKLKRALEMRFRAAQIQP
jgi:NTE family protein